MDNKEKDAIKTLYVYIDESGSIVKAKDASPRTKNFIIGIIITDNPVFVQKVFKRERLKAIKECDWLQNELSKNHEIKGSNISEKLKLKIYKQINEKCEENFEYAVIHLDNKKSYDYFKVNKARVFNFLLKLFFRNCFRHKTKFKNFDALQICIDERNVATKSLNTLEEFLETEINLNGTMFPKGIKVKYCDSKNNLLIQLADFIANTAYRYLLKPNHQDNKASYEEISLNQIGKSKYTFPLF